MKMITGIRYAKDIVITLLLTIFLYSSAIAEGASKHHLANLNTGDDVLTIGTLLSKTGVLRFLGKPTTAAARLAVLIINLNGGVFGKSVRLVESDSGDTPDFANRKLAKLLRYPVNADVIVGPISSAITFSGVYQQTKEAGVVLISPSNTSPTLSCDFTQWSYDGILNQCVNFATGDVNNNPADHYFRTSPSDVLQGEILAKLINDDGDVNGDGTKNVLVLWIADFYGFYIQNSLSLKFTELGGIANNNIYFPDPNTGQLPQAEIDFIVQTVKSSTPLDAIVVVGFSETGQIISALHAEGLGPTSAINWWGVDGNMSDNLAQLVSPDASILNGMRGALAGVWGGEEYAPPKSIQFLLNLMVGQPLTEYSYSAETYDAVIISALAAITAEKNNPHLNVASRPDLIAAEMNSVTNDGEACYSFGSCKAKIQQGKDIHYIGFAGPHHFNQFGDPSTASFLILGFDGSPFIKTLDRLLYSAD